MLQLYAYQPTGHGSQSFFTVAESEEQAFAQVSAHIATEYSANAYSTEGWGTDYYQLTVSPAGGVIENENS